MAAYRVIWEIDIEADTPLHAARQAADIQRDPQSIAVVFEVKEMTPKGWMHVENVDLEQECAAI